MVHDASISREFWRTPRHARLNLLLLLLVCFTPQGMQGWRPYMEDAHFALASLGGAWSDTAAFGVMDGHGGREAG